MTYHDDFIQNKQSAEELKAHLAAIIESSNDAIISKNLDGTITSWNAAAERLFGYKAEEIVGKHITTIIPPDRHQEENHILDKLRKGERLSHFETVRLTKDGRRIDISLTISPIRNAKGEIIGASKVARDVTTERRIAKALQEDESRLRFFSAFEESIRALRDPIRIMEVATRMTAEHLGASRCAYADVEPDGDHFTIRHDYVADHSASTEGYYSLALFGSRAVKDLYAGRTLVIRNVRAELSEKDGAEMFGAIGIDAIITCPLVKEGRLHAMMAVHQNAPRDWAASEIQVMEQIAERSWAHIERVRFDAKLHESEEQFRHLANAMPQIVWTAQPGGQIDYVNDRCHEYAGISYTPDTPIDWTPIIHPDDLAHTLETWDNCIAAGRHYEVQHRFLNKPSGQYRWNLTRALPIWNQQGNIVKWYGTSTDIEAQRKASEDLREAKEHLQLIFESAQDFAIISMDVDGNVTSWNKGAERIFGYTPEEMLGQPSAIIFTPEDRAHHAPEAEIATARRVGRAEDERWHIRKDGQLFYVSGIMAAMVDEAGQIQGFTKIARDVTVQKRAEEELIQARNAAEAANIAKTEFLANMSHEIRTPMNAVIGLSGIIAQSQPLTPKQREYIKTLQMSADSLLSLINDMLDIAKIEARTVELEQIPFNMAQIMREIISMMNVRLREKNLVLFFDGESIANRVFLGDPTRLRQIVTNLLSNAVKFTEKGSVHISITGHPTAQERTQEICIAVRDTGIGIAPDKLETIFHKFVQADTSINRKYGGTGLGLAITKTLAEIMGGTIEVESVLGEGSCFTLCIPLPLADDEEVAHSNKALVNILETSIEVQKGPRILLVEDYAPNVMVATAYLDQFGYACDVANNGLEAIDKIKHGHYALVLMDVQMHGMNGLEATRIIRAYEEQKGSGRIPIVGMTAHALMGDKERCLAAGMDDYISKPFNPSDLEALIKRYRDSGQ